MNPRQLSATPGGALRTFVVLLLLVWIPPVAAVQDCESLESLRKNAQSNFSKIMGAKLEDDGAYLSSLTLPNAHRCVIQIYSATEAKYSCEWLVAKERSAEAAVRGTFDDFVAEVARCAQSKNEVVRKKHKSRSGEVTLFPDAGYSGKGGQASVGLEYSYFSPWWLIELDYRVGGMQ